MTWMFDNLILVIVYTILSVVNLYAVLLYRKAYIMMKRTRMIKSVYILLITLLIENVYFMAAAISRIGNESIVNKFLHPVCWSIPKLALLWGLVCFIDASLSPSDDEFCESIENAKKKIKEVKKKNGT